MYFVKLNRTPSFPHVEINHCRLMLEEKKRKKKKKELLQLQKQTVSLRTRIRTWSRLSARNINSRTPKCDVSPCKMTVTKVLSQARSGGRELNDRLGAGPFQLLVLGPAQISWVGKACRVLGGRASDVKWRTISTGTGAYCGEQRSRVSEFLDLSIVKPIVHLWKSEIGTEIAQGLI
ncbi:hypothetical protein BDW75DRAFT_42210 [Aspergillus navahoensis]